MPKRLTAGLVGLLLGFSFTTPAYAATPTPAYCAPGAVIFHSLVRLVDISGVNPSRARISGQITLERADLVSLATQARRTQPVTVVKRLAALRSALANEVSAYVVLDAYAHTHATISSSASVVTRVHQAFEAESFTLSDWWADELGACRTRIS